MQFVVPKFIEQSVKVIGPFTFKQFIFVAIAGVLAIVFYIIMGSGHPMLFITVLIVLGAIALALAFLKINGLPLSTVIFHSLKFSFAPKAFFFRKKAVSPSLISEIREEEEKKAKTPELKLEREGQLHKLSTQVEFRTR